jgi:predicted ArsR family transcriptional regulator
MNHTQVEVEPHQLARKFDPSTSHDAAGRVRKFAKGQYAAILAALRNGGDMTPEKIGVAIHLDAYQVRKRLPELERAGLAQPTGETAPTRSGRSQRVWRAV